MIPEHLFLEALDTVRAWGLDPEDFALAVNQQAQLLTDTEYGHADDPPSPYAELRF